MKNKWPVIATIVAIMILSPIFIYVISLGMQYLFHKFDLPIIADTKIWITFIGSIIGGTITMAVLYFTLYNESKKKEEEKNLNFMPILKGELLDTYADLSGAITKIDVGNCINEYGKIKWLLRNTSHNYCNDVEFGTSVTYTFINDEKIPLNLVEHCIGIQIFNVEISQKVSIAEGKCHKYLTNIHIDTKEDGGFYFGTNARIEHHIPFFSYDIFKKQKYEAEYIIDIIINVDINGKLIFFIENENTVYIDNL